MSSNSTPSSKITVPVTPTGYSQTPLYGGTDLSQKRSNSSGNHGSGLQTRQAGQPRNQQIQRKQNKSRKRVRLVDDDAIAEAAAMRSINSRKGQTSITHLMSFSLPPRPQYQPSHHNHHQRTQRYNRTWGLGSGYHAVDKAKYVHANYRFIVRPDQNYHTQTVDADIHISWDTVMQILASADTQSTNCPICLSTPVAPRMAKCGHIFCLSCLIRYMHSTDDTNPVPEKRARWKKCPICEDSIYISEVRPVRWFSGQEASMLREGGDVLLRLLKRFPGTTLALPRDAADKYGQQPEIPWFHVAEMMDYARFMKAGEAYMVEQYNLETAALEEQEKEDELIYGDDTTWTRKALAAVEEAKIKVQGLANPPSLQAQPNETMDKIPESWDDDDDDATTNAEKSSTISNNLARLSFSNAQGMSSKSRMPYYFYHALPNFYLSPLDIRILKAAFGEFSAFPSTILPRVEHISTGHVVDDDLRKRAKYMAHLPQGAEVSMIECDWTDIISPGILKQFEEDIQRRRRRNHEKEAREERDRIRAEKEEDEKRWAAARRRRPSIEKNLSEADFTPLHSMNASPPVEESLAQTPPWSNQRSHSAFATLASPGTSPDGPRTVWGTAAIAPNTPPLKVTQPPPQIVDDGWLQDWEKDLLDEADAVALVAASTVGEGTSKQAAVQSNKRNKKKKITLMSTNARRGA